MKRLAGDDWCTILCEPDRFTVPKMCVFLPPMFLFFLYSTSGMSVRVLRLMFVPGCGGPHTFVSFVSLPYFPSRVIALSGFHLSPCSITSHHLRFSISLSPPPVLPFYLLCSFHFSFPHLILIFLLSLILLPFSSHFCLEGPMGALWFVSWKAYQHHRRHHWNLALFSFSSPSSSLMSFFFLFPMLSPFFFPPLFLMWKF